MAVGKTRYALTIKLFHAVLFLGDQRVWKADLLPVLDTLTLRICQAQSDLKLRFDSALPIFGRDAQDLDLKAEEMIKV